MAKVVVYDDNGDIIFSKSIDSEIKEVNIKTSNKEINFCIEEKEIDIKAQTLKDMLDDDKFWE